MGYTALQPITTGGYDIIAIDTEQDNNADPYVWCVAGFYKGKKIERTFYSSDRCGKYLFNKHRSWNKVILTGFNIKFDLNTLFQKGVFEWELLEKQGSFITAIPPKNLDRHKNTLKIIEASNFHPGKRLTDIIKDKDGNFIEKYLWFINEVGGSIHIDKHILGKDGNKEEMRRACISHAWAAVYALYDIQKQIRSLHSQIELTPALTAQKLHRRNYLEKECQILPIHTSHITDEVKLFMNKAYYGGRTENMIKADSKNIIKGVTGIDINSSYPNVMRNNEYPDIITYREVMITKANQLIKYMKEYEGLAWIEIESPTDQKIMLLPFIDNNKLCFPKGKWVGSYTFPEIRKAIEVGYKIINVWQVGICKPTKKPLFKKYVDELYKLKKDPEYKAVAKLMLNSLYGKFGQKANEKSGWQPVLESEIPDNIFIDLDGIILDDKKGHISNDWKIYNDIIMQYIPESPLEDRGFSRTAYPLLAAYVTSYARIFLYEAMEAIGLDKIYYCDTDSIYGDTKAINRAIESGKLKIDKENLGEWDIEHDNCDMEIRGLKYYRTRDKNYSYLNLCGGMFDFEFSETDDWEYVIKGVPKRFHKEFWENKKISYERPVKLTSAIRFNKKVNLFETVSKSDRKPEAKRIFQSDNNSTPIIIYNEFC